MKRRKYRDHSVLFVVAVLAYVSFANMSGRWAANRLEIFPFFNWGLFTNFTSETRYDAAIFIERLNWKKLPEPALVNLLKEQFGEIGNGIMLLKATRILAKAIAHGDHDRIHNAKNTIERLYLRGPNQLEYSVRLISYSPLERYRNGRVNTVKILRTFQKRD